jgi:hypothetical protein
MDATKLRLSAEEMELMLRPDWILTKNRILQKVWQLLESVQSRQQAYISRLPAEISSINAKISKGENYQGLPYLILDQPRYFNKEKTFAIRTLFWWGHFFSSTLHLSGMYKKMYENKITGAFQLLQEETFVCVNQDPWEHHFGDTNFVSLNTMTATRFEEIIHNGSFIKLSKKVPLLQWETMEERLLKIFGDYVALLQM